MGPQRPRKDNVVRYCLNCSEKNGRLVERQALALEKRRQKSTERAQEKSKAKARRKRQAEKRMTHLTLTDAAGRVVELDVEKTVFKFANRTGVDLWSLSWNRRRGRPVNSGRAWPTRNHVHLTIGSPSLEWFCKVAAHELAHLAAGPGHGHDETWRDKYEEICAKLWDTKPVFRLGVQHHRYAIDPEILSQLEATSRGEYRRSKAKLPLAGRLINAGETT